MDSVGRLHVYIALVSLYLEPKPVQWTFIETLLYLKEESLGLYSQKDLDRL